jgi:teichuronic acid biosynthesis glycosyltransferase TuaG
MKISIVIPVYNTEKYIEKCIESALNQSYPDIEILVINDGSTDSTELLLKKFENKIKIINKKNGGTASALNMGIKNMTGDWFKWLSADDILKIDAIEKLVFEIQKLGKDAENCIFYSNYDIIDKDGNVIDTFEEPNNHSLDTFQRNIILLDHYYGNGTTSIMHKSIFDKCGIFDETLGYKDDYEFWLRCCLLYGYDLYLVNENLAQYRIHESQLTKKRYDYALEQIEHIKSKIISQLSPDLQMKYVTAVKNYQKQIPFKIKVRRNIRNIMFKLLPKIMSNKILGIYLNRKSN